MSEFLPEKNKNSEMVFKFEFSDIFRVKTLKITWIVVPDEIKIEYSSDNS